MSARPPSRAARLLLPALTALTALTLTACEDGEGLRDEGPSTAGVPTATAPGAPSLTPASGRPPRPSR
ncbi:hypothetical protein GA0115242_107720 [Streptomyces sp. SolWspMP-5a-2]|nr:hypothetical protein GA0115242_107720 [Streptomyces sp. SolWspMP-5a-2]